MERNFFMNEISYQHPAAAFIAFRAMLVCEVIVFLIAAPLHTGAFGVPALFAAMIAEGLCGLGCLVSAYTLFTHQPRALQIAVIVQIFVLFAVLLGITVIVRSPAMRTPLNLGLHGAMLALIGAGLALLAVPGTRTAFSREPSQLSGKG